MDHSDLNFGHLLFLLNNEVLTNKIRSIEKINERIINIKNGMHFMKCASKKAFNILFLIYIYIYYSHHIEINQEIDCNILKTE